MVGYSVRWMWSHRKVSIGAFLLLAFFLVNLLAYLHARAMTTFAPAGVRTAKPELLSPLEKAKVVLTGVTIPRPVANGVTPERCGLPFELHQIQGQNDVELEAWHISHRRAKALVLMFSGYAACKAALLPEARALHDLGYNLLLVDFQGAGGSTGNDTTIGVREADDVALAVEYARVHWNNQPLILYGQSMGSVAVMRAVAMRNVQAQAVVLECPFDRLINTVGNRFSTMGLPASPGA